MYNDEWIIENYQKTDSWKALLEEHNRLFGTAIGYQAWKTHVIRKLKLHRPQFRFTDEMNEYLREWYPKIGKHVFNGFNARFSAKTTEHSLQQHCVCDLGLRIGKERHDEIIRIATSNVRKQVERNTKYKVGEISEGMFGGGGYLGIKTKSGWERLERYVWRSNGRVLPEGYVIIHLDGDKRNCDIDNLVAITNEWQAQLNYMCQSGNVDIKKACIEYMKLKQVFEEETSRH